MNKFLEESSFITKIIKDNNFSEKILAPFYLRRMKKGNYFSEYDAEFLNYVTNDKYNYKDEKIVEIGCGIGQNLIFLDRLGFKAAGIEPSRRINLVDIYNQQNNGKIDVFKEFFPTKRKFSEEIFYVGNICHTNTGNKFIEITDALLESKELFIAKENFLCKTSAKYQENWLKYFNKKCASLELKIVETKNLYIVKRDVYE